MSAREVQDGDRNITVPELLGEHVLERGRGDVELRVLELPGELGVGGVERGVRVQSGAYRPGRRPVSHVRGGHV